MRANSILALVECLGILALSVLLSSLGIIGDTASYDNSYWPLTLLTALIWIWILFRSGSYSSLHLHSGTDYYLMGIRPIVSTIAIATVICVAVGVPISRWPLLGLISGGLVWIALARFSFRKILNSRGAGLSSGFESAILVREKGDLDEVQKIASRSNNGLRVVGLISDDCSLVECSGFEYLGPESQLSTLVSEHNLYRLIVWGRSIDSVALDSLAWALHGTSCNLTVVMDLARASAPRIEIHQAYGTTIGEVSTPGQSVYGAAAKRVLDLSVACFLLLLLSPLLALTALMIVIEDRGPVFFRQSRVGKDLREFEIFKFRSMFVDAPLREAALRAQYHRPGEMWKVVNDPRVTRIGRLIRATSIDELPQLLNVVKGDMSLVGPRPKQRWELDHYSEYQLRRFVVKPGITGLSQVSGRSDLTVDEAAELDLAYIRNWSLLSDLTICLQTARVLASREGAR